MSENSSWHVTRTQLRSMIRDRIKYMEWVISSKEKALQGAPQGYLKGGSHAGDKKFQYCWRENYRDQSEWKYIKHNNHEFAEKLAQANYDRKVLLSAEIELKRLKKIDALSDDKSVEYIYKSLPKSFQKIVDPLEETDEQFYQRWRDVKFIRKGFKPDDTSSNYTVLGERVRSKSELMIADALTRHGIPYIYEKPLELAGYGTVYPDLTLLDFWNRREIYWEHLGILGNQEYARHSMSKLIDYERNGILPGDRLILTAESADKPLDTRVVELEIARLSCCVLPDSLRATLMK